MPLARHKRSSLFGEKTIAEEKRVICDGQQEGVDWTHDPRPDGPDQVQPRLHQVLLPQQHVQNCKIVHGATV